MFALLCDYETPVGCSLFILIPNQAIGGFRIKIGSNTGQKGKDSDFLPLMDFYSGLLKEEYSAAPSYEALSILTSTSLAPSSQLPLFMTEPILLQGQGFNSFGDAFFRVAAFSHFQRGNLNVKRRDTSCRHYTCTNTTCPIEAFVSQNSKQGSHILKRLNITDTCFASQPSKRGTMNSNGVNHSGSRSGGATR